MRTAQLLLFYLLKWCQTAESLIDKRVILGRNVTLDCPIGNKEIYWFVLKLPDPPVVILRTFRSESTYTYLYQERFKDKYSTQTHSRLFIINVSIDELGIYYCAKSGGSSLELSNGTRLSITEPLQDHNRTECNEQKPQFANSPDVQKILTISSFLLNIMLMIAITGLLMIKLKKPTKCRPHLQNVEPEPLEDLNAAQYSEIELPACSRRENANQMNITYELLQKPKPRPSSLD